MVSETAGDSGIELAADNMQNEIAVLAQSEAGNPVLMAADNAENPALPSAASEQPDRPEAASKPYTPEQILLIIWAAGSVCVLAWFLFSNIRFTICLRKSRTLLDPAFVSSIMQTNGNELGNISGSDSWQPPIYLSPIVETPCLFGLLHPAIYVTGEVSRDEVALRHVLLHETTHYRHEDHIWSFLRGLCLAVHWFNPLVWWAAFLSKRDCELACDAATLKVLGTGNRSEYGNTLLNITISESPAVMLAATTMSGKKSVIYERIKMITSADKKSVMPILAVLLIVVIALGCTFTGAVEDVIEESTQESSVIEDTEEQTHVIDLLEPVYTMEDGNGYHYDRDKKKWITEDGHEYDYKYILGGMLEPSSEEGGNVFHYDPDKRKWVTEDGREYAYGSILGGMFTSSDNACYIILTNREDVTFEECVRSGAGSNPEETIIMEQYFGEDADFTKQYYHAEETGSGEYSKKIEPFEPEVHYELQIPLEKNGWTLLSADASDTFFVLTYRYPENLYSDRGGKWNCATLTAIRLQDGTLINIIPYDLILSTGAFTGDYNQAFVHQYFSLDSLIEYNPTLSQKQFSLKDIAAVYIAEWDPQEKTFDLANEIEIVLQEADIQ